MTVCCALREMAGMLRTYGAPRRAVTRRVRIDGRRARVNEIKNEGNAGNSLPVQQLRVSEGSMGNLDQEIATYNRHFSELLVQQGKFVLIKATEIAGIFDSYQDALTAGYQRFKLNVFLVKQIIAAERLALTRDLVPRAERA